MTSKEITREDFLKELYRKTVGELSAFDMNNIANCVQHYIPCNISIKIAKDATEFLQNCLTSTSTKHDYVDDIEIPLTKISHLLVWSKEMEILHFTPVIDDALLLLGTIRFSTDKVNFVLLKHEVYKSNSKTPELEYELTILIPEMRQS